jgi:hypothetical protein
VNDTLVLLVLGGVVLVLLAVPLLKRGATAPAPRPPDPEDSDAPDALREIELDRAMGKLSEQDYETLRAKLARDVGRATKDRGQGRGHADSGEGHEGETPASRVTRIASRERVASDESQPEGHPAVADRAEALVARWRAVAVDCGVCGTRPEPDARFCSNCGRFLLACPECGERVEEVAPRFCPACGTGLAA